MSKTARRAILLPLLLLLKNEGQTTASAQKLSMPRTNNTVYKWDDPSSIPGPRDPSRLLPDGGNACDSAASGPVGYGCVHMALMSDDMLAAAKYDQLEKDFLYGVAGGPDATHCGECHQIQVGSVQNSGVWIPDFKQLIVQVVNSGGDVESKQLDIMMGAGGMGFMQAVNRDCSMENKPDADVGDSSNNHLHHCGGGPCNSAGGMFAGDYNAWTMPGKRGCYDGGIRALNASDRRLTQLCKGLSNGETALKDRILFDSCYRTNKYAWHQDFLSYRRVRVACPEALYRLTGLRRQDEVDGSIQLPQAHIDNVLPEECEAGGRPCIGTMMDGCMPSCSWSRPDFFTASQDYPRVDWCDANNQPQ